MTTWAAITYPLKLPWMHNLTGTHTLTPIGINLTRLTENCSDQLSDIDKYADFIVTAISTAVDKAIPTSKGGRPESQPVSEESLALIEEKRRQDSQAHDPFIKICINQLQKKIKDNLRIESQASWEKFCNETNHTESWRRIKNFLKPNGQHDYLAL